MAKFKKLLVFATACAGALFMGCGSNAVSVDEDYVGGTSAALFKIAAAPNTPFAQIADSASLTISASDMDDFVRELMITDSTVRGSITGIPAGRGRVFTVAVFDSLDSLQYQGTATADLLRGATVNVPITLYRVGAGAVINGTVEESPAAGARVVFQSDRDGGMEIWSVSNDGSDLKQLTDNDMTYKYHPQWSPDGKQIAYVEGNSYTSGYDITIIDLDGEHLQTLSAAASVVGVHGLEWSKDGNWIYYVEATTCANRVRKLNIVNNAIDSVVIDRSGVQVLPVVAPDNSSLLYCQDVCGSPSSSSLKLLDLSDNSSADLFTFDSNYAWGKSAWSSDGNRIALSRFDRNNTYPIRIVISNPDGNESNVIESCQGQFPAFCMNDTRIVFTRPKNDDGSTQFWNLWMMDTDGNDLTQITNGDFVDSFPDVYEP